jgi:exodeoxyribonuclease V alpha subunit
MSATTRQPTKDAPAGELAELVGVFGRVVWQDPKVTQGPRFLIATLEDKTTIKGEADPGDFVPGISYRFYGRWGKAHSKYGQAFEFKQVVQQAPHSRFGVVQHLLKYAAGIGPVFAAQLWDAFGTDAVKMLRTDVAAVATACPAIPRQRLNDASASLRELAGTEDVRIELTGLFDGRGFEHKLIELCIKKWGIHAPRRIKHDPFTLLVNKFPGCGFDRCDRLWSDLGLPPERIKRQLMCLWRALQENGDGNTWHPMTLARDVILQKISGVATDKVDWRRAVKLGLRSRWLASRCDQQGKWWLAIGEQARDEAELAAHLVRISEAPPVIHWPDPDTIEGLTEHHRDTLRKCFAGGNLAVLGGTPGTGKTTTSGAVLRVLAQRIGSQNIIACTPTGKASVRLRQSLIAAGVTGIEPVTIHRTLGVQRNGNDGAGWDFWYSEKRQLPYMVYLLDESSMLDTGLANKLFQAIPSGALVLIVGDPYQLPPVDHGAMLRDAIAAKLPYGELSIVLRNNGDAVKACKAIREGRRFETSTRIDLKAGHNFRHVPSKSPAFSVAVMKKLVLSACQHERDGHPINPVWDVQVITALNDAGVLSRKNLNTELRAALNPDGMQADGCPFRKGDKVICKDNCVLRVIDESQADEIIRDDDDEQQLKDFADDVAKGEIGQVIAVSSEHMAVKIQCPDRCVYVPRKRPDDDKRAGSFFSFDLGYAITFHKSQGSQWPIVILMADRGANRLGSRELWYTGISRIESLVITIGERDVIDRQCQRVVMQDRKTFLKELIQMELEKHAAI